MCFGLLRTTIILVNHRSMDKRSRRLGPEGSLFCSPVFYGQTSRASRILSINIECNHSQASETLHRNARRS